MSESTCRGMLEGVIHRATLALFHRGGRPPRAAAAESLPTNLLRFAAFELAVWASLYAAYLAVRGATIGSPEDALRNGREIVAAENALRIFHEARIQEALSALEWFFSAYYMVGFAPLIAITLVWLALRHVHRYRELRTALLVSISIATVVFVLFPAAPPRLIPDLGIADTVGLSSHDTGSFAGVRFNPYAAMPSMHVGWSLLVGLFGYRAARRRATRALFAAHPAVMVAAVMATGNHFVLDAVAGAAIAGAVVAVMRLAAVRRAAISAQTPHRNRRRKTCPSTAGVTATSILRKRGSMAAIVEPPMPTTADEVKDLSWDDLDRLRAHACDGDPRRGRQRRRGTSLRGRELGTRHSCNARACSRRGRLNLGHDLTSI